MPWTLNPVTVGTPILSALTNYTGWGFPGGATVAVPFSGVMPLDPSITTGITSLISGTKALSSNFYLASDGITSLGTPIVFTPNSSGTLSFVRFYHASTTYPLFDVSCSTTASDDTAVANTLTIVSGTPFSITDLRLKLNTTGNTSVSPSVANHFVNLLASNYSPSYGQGLYAGSNHDPITGLYNRVVSIKLYSGAIPNRADSAPTGTELWTANLSGSNDLFNSSGLGLSLQLLLTANAIATGIPTYCRIRKAGFVSSGITFPETIIQVPVTTDGSGCTISASSFTSGQSYSITGLTLTLQ